LYPRDQAGEGGDQRRLPAGVSDRQQYRLGRIAQPSSTALVAQFNLGPGAGSMQGQLQLQPLPVYLALTEVFILVGFSFGQMPLAQADLLAGGGDAVAVKIVAGGDVDTDSQFIAMVFAVEH